MGPRSDGIAAQKTILGMFESSLSEHAKSKSALDSCVLPTQAFPACGASQDLAHVHHMALCTLINGQTALLTFRKETMIAEIQDEEDRFAQTIGKTRADFDDGLEVDKKSGTMKAHGWPAIIIASVVAILFCLWAVRQIGNVSPSAPANTRVVPIP